MADHDWKSRVGVEINLSSTDDEDEKTPCPSVPIRATETTEEFNFRTAPVLTPSLPLDYEFDCSADPYIELGRTPPRTRIARNMKEKRIRDSGENVLTRSAIRRQEQRNRQKRRNSSVDLRLAHPDTDSPEYSSQLEYDSCKFVMNAGDERHRRKRSLKLLRESERDLKLGITIAETRSTMAGISNLVTTFDAADDRAESMPTPAVKVETCKRFMSVASRLVMCQHEDVQRELPARTHAGKTPDNECPKNRVDFYNTFSLLIRMGNPDRQQEKNGRKQPSHEETLWQSELNDLLWLELQAWLSDRTPTQQDLYLCNARKHVGELLAEVAAYRFSIDAPSTSNGSVDSGVVGEDHVSFRCLSMYCIPCMDLQNTALNQVEALLSRLEAAVALYPSSKAMAMDHPVFESQQLSNKLAALCLWYNMTRLLRLKVRIIGKLLHQLRTHRGSSSSNGRTWPRLDEVNTPSPGATVQVTSPEPPNLGQSMSRQQVQFHLSDLANSVSSSSPSESNSSTGSTTAQVAATDSVLSASSSRSSLETAGISSNGSVKCCGDASIPHLRDGDGKVPQCGPSPYRAYIEDVLKSQGLKKAMLYLDRLHQHLLSKARVSLEKPPESSFQISLLDVIQEPLGEELDLRRYGHWSQEAQFMHLPSYRPAFLFLSRIPLDLIHEYLRLRLEQKPLEPSPLCIRQLMREMKEGLREGVKQRQRYVHLMRSAIWDAMQDVVDRLEQDVADFDRIMKAILEVYLEYLQQWVLMVQKDVLVCPYQKTLLEEEWKFVKVTCPYIPNGEALAANSFCRMASGMLNAIVDHLNSSVDGLTSLLDESNVEVENEETNPKQTMLAACRGIQSVFHEARERALRAVAFAKTLRKDLEIAASFELVAPIEQFLLRLWQAGHVRVVAPHSCSHLMFVPVCLKERPDLVCRLLNMNLTSCCAGGSGTIDEQISSYLVLARCSQPDLEQWSWPGETISIQPTAETTITLSHVEVKGVLLVVCDPGQLAKHRRHLAYVLEECVTLTQDSLPSNYTIAESLSELKLDAVTVRDCLANSIESVERRFDVRAMAELDEIDRLALASRCREILHQCYKFGFEYNKEVSRLITGKAEKQMAIGMINFCMQWMRFVGERCERGRGLRPRWATQGLDFLMTACEPDKTKFLKDEEFEEMKKKMDACISHVIGSADRCPSRNSVLESHSRGSSPAPHSRRPYRSSRSLPDKPEAQAAQAAAQAAVLPGKDNATITPVNGSSSVPSTPELLDSRAASRHINIPANGIEGNIIETLKIPSKFDPGWQERVQDAVIQLERQLDAKMRKQELIGSVTEVHNLDRVHIKARSVTFSWQRGIKIGQGRFGKVYTAVNNATGELMAMKEIAFQPNDHRTIRSVAEELHIFEGIQYKHLVRYYGVEIHREEMLIFMEYCEEGTLESLVAAYPAGLPEKLVRSFTRQLLLAVSVLHQHGIVHRDIKTANIFLTDEGNCLKLGDFGSAVKIKSHTTVPGELQGFVGTQAYMAPEVFMKSNTDGHGRAADIWSVGCVVVEMASGKRPWHEYDSNYQIMFKVGMGEVPTYPDSLSEEGHNFLDLCLQHEPRQRASADQLLEHPFVKVDLDSEEDDYENASTPSEHQQAILAQN